MTAMPQEDYVPEVQIGAAIFSDWRYAEIWAQRVEKCVEFGHLPIGRADGEPTCIRCLETVDVSERVEP